MKSYGVTIQMKPLQQYFHMVFSVLYVVLTFESVDETLWCDHSKETSSAVLSLGLILFVLRAVQNVEPMDEILWCDHSNETSSTILSHGTICFVCSSNFWVCG